RRHRDPGDLPSGDGVCVSVGGTSPASRALNSWRYFRRWFMSRWKALAVAMLLVPMIGALRAQDEPRTQDKEKGKSTDQRMPTFEPGKEHQLLKQFDGEWEFTAKCQMPGMEPMEGKGTETARLAYGG